MRGFARVGVSFSILVFLLSSATSFAASNKKPPTATQQDPAASCASLLTDAIPLKWVEKMIREGKATDEASQRLREAVQRMGFTNTAMNLAVLRAHNENYTVQLEQGPPTDQKQSGRCWLFAGLNMLRSTLIAEGKVPANFEFSENYLHFFNMLEKSNRYLESVISKTYKTKGAEKLSRDELKSAFEPNLGDGGWYEYFMFLVSKYGVVPKDVMPETKSSQNTATLQAELKRHLAQTARELLHEAQQVAASKKDIDVADYLERVRAIKERGMSGVWRILATHLGDPPAEFDFRQNGKAEKHGLAVVTPTTVRHYTPVEYARDFVKFDPSDYVVVASTPLAPAGVYEQPGSGIGPSEAGQPSYDIRFMNVSVDRLEQLAVASIDNGNPVWFAADVSRDVDHATGIMHPAVYQRDAVYNLPEADKLAKLTRKLNSFFGIASPNHAMLLTGYDRPDSSGPVVKFKNENSWGPDVGTRGTYHLYREWFRQNVFQIVVHKKVLSDAERTAWEGPAKKVDKDAELF